MSDIEEDFVEFFILDTLPLPGIRGNYSFRLIVLYTKKAPQLSAQELVIFTKNMAAAATKCCPLNDEQQFACMENSVSTPSTACLSVVKSSELQAPAISLMLVDTSMNCQWNLIILSLREFISGQFMPTVFD